MRDGSAAETRRRRGECHSTKTFVLAPGRSDDVVALDEALGSLAKVDEQKSRIIELRYLQSA